MNGFVGRQIEQAFDDWYSPIELLLLHVRVFQVVQHARQDMPRVERFQHRDLKFQRSIGEIDDETAAIFDARYPPLIERIDVARVVPIDDGVR